MRSILWKFLALVLMAPALLLVGALWTFLAGKTFQHFAPTNPDLAIYMAIAVLISPLCFVVGVVIINEVA